MYMLKVANHDCPLLYLPVHSVGLVLGLVIEQGTSVETKSAELP